MRSRTCGSPRRLPGLEGVLQPCAEAVKDQCSRAEDCGCHPDPAEALYHYDGDCDGQQDCCYGFHVAPVGSCA